MLYLEHDHLGNLMVVFIKLWTVLVEYIPGLNALQIDRMSLSLHLLCWLVLGRCKSHVQKMSEVLYYSHGSSDVEEPHGFKFVKKMHCVQVMEL